MGYSAEEAGGDRADTQGAGDARGGAWTAADDSDLWETVVLGGLDSGGKVASGPPRLPV